ncbi:UNKNOWN [Stylonychia lemnae]|uniref:CCT domain-containing protein n=1 Tax=Stylonychia lemnae TaxID=5949 RepID=A0A078B1V0_STYLE|nr:UNKNOWN [Stylonychia lemnae]|eukprot:CDW88535.1 UNKNOWN [Stylonychia lemnae]
MEIKAMNYKSNMNNLIEILSLYSKMPKYKNAQFSLPNICSDFQDQIFTQSELNHYIWQHKLIQCKDQMHQELELITDNRYAIEEKKEGSTEASTLSPYPEKDDQQKRKRKYVRISDKLKDLNFEINSNSDENQYIDQNIQSDPVQDDYIKQGIDNQKLVGKYDLQERAKRILKYKTKAIKHRTLHPIMKKFNGRSKVATNKVRYNGRFVKASILSQASSNQ